MDITINLIPEYKKIEIIKANRFRWIAKAGLFVLIFLLIFIAYLFGLQKALEIHTRQMNTPWLIS